MPFKGALHALEGGFAFRLGLSGAKHAEKGLPTGHPSLVKSPMEPMTPPALSDPSAWCSYRHMHCAPH
jgi:hypothetical protein